MKEALKAEKAASKDSKPRIVFWWSCAVSGEAARMRNRRVSPCGVRLAVWYNPRERQPGVATRCEVTGRTCVFLALEPDELCGVVPGRAPTDTPMPDAHSVRVPLPGVWHPDPRRRCACRRPCFLPDVRGRDGCTRCPTSTSASPSGSATGTGADRAGGEAPDLREARAGAHSQAS